MFYLGGVGLAVFLTLLLVSKGKKTTADKILGAWLLLITIHLLLFYFRKMSLYPQTLGIEMPLPLGHGPFLYLYTRALTNRTLSIKASFLHFLPFIIILFYITPFLSLSVAQKILVYRNHGAGYETFNLIKSVFIITSGVLYVALASFDLRRHRILIQDQFSQTEKINLRWLQYLIYWIGVIWVFVILRNDDLVFAAAVFFIVFIGFFGIRQAGIFYTPDIISTASLSSDSNEIDITKETSADLEKRKYQKSGLTANSAIALHQLLIQVMNEEKLYLKSELALAELAERLNTQPNYLSQVINEKEGKNFYDYINTLRIEEFTRIASGADSRKYTLMALAQRCGFNSKSSFNRYFKKVKGQSPSEFMFTVSSSEK